MPHYVAHFKPSQSESGRWTSHLRDISVTFTAKDDNAAREMINKNLTRLFLATADDMTVEWWRI